MESKKEMLQKVLGMDLSIAQMIFIEKGWLAFYNEPHRYTNSVVSGMVKLDLETSPISAEKTKQVYDCFKLYTRGLITLHEYEKMLDDIDLLERLEMETVNN